MLEITNLSCGYGGTDIIKNINLKVEDGETLCIVGPNGSGKSTLLRAAARLLEFRGSVAVDGKETASFSRKELAKKIALLGQNSPLYFPYTVYDTVAMGRYAYGAGLFGGLSAACKKIIAETLEVLGLDNVQNSFVSELSGGQLQRVFLARTLVQESKIVLLDEPANHLDLKHQTGLLDHLGTLSAGRGKTVIAVLHDLNLARHYGKTAVLMREGTIAARGGAETVFSDGVLADVYGMDIGRFMRKSLENWKK
jgi:iron complex transport system ATP-binding protein